MVKRILYRAPFEPVFRCREMPTRHCPGVYEGVCGERPCARYESENKTPWLPELELLQKRRMRPHVIPVRVDPSIKPHIVRAGITIRDNDPLAPSDCPVCDEPLTASPVSLVFVGREHSERWTAGSVAVHDRCTGVPTPDGMPR